MIMGYSVDFPEGKRPFPAQLAVMNKVLLALKTGQHALLESPTGSGKTLALLCSALTFQRRHAAELLQAAEEQRRLALAAHAAKRKHIEQLNLQRAADAYVRASEAAMGAGSVASSRAAGPGSAANDADDDDDFAASQPSFERFRFAAAAAKSRLVDDGWVSMDSKKSHAAKRASSAGTGDAGDDDDDDDFETPETQPASKKQRVLPSSFAGTQLRAADGSNPPAAGLREPTKRSLPASFGAAAASPSHAQFHAAEPSEDGKLKSARVAPPTIFFCSRTHSQLSQVVDELKNCPVSYLAGPDATNPLARELRMCVLGSKPQFCVNSKVNRDPSQVDDKCRSLMDAGGCTFANKRRKTNDLKRVAPPVWDIEDIVALAKRHRECGFFHARDALQDANIVFCPYNYILDPGIRAAVNISLRNAIVIFDEAHNVEDTCRSSASLELTAELLGAASKAFTNVIKHGARPATYHSLLKVLNGLGRWLQGISANAGTVLRPTGFEEESKVWNGVDALAMFTEYTGLTPASLAAVKADLAAVAEHEKELSTTTSSDQSQPPSSAEQGGANPSMLLGTMPLSTVRMVVNVADYMFRDDLKYLDDFKLIVRKTRTARGGGGGGGRFRGSYAADVKTTTNTNGGWEFKMCIWCLNAAVAFADVVKAARSVILTSGTLSPMDSFAGELGADFPIRLEANHVVDMRKQVFAGAIMRGPGGVDLSSTYANQQEFRYQDSMGQLLLQYAQIVPGGILMFFPSYSLLDKLATRWRQTGLWGQVDAVKTLYSEPRKAGKDFDALLDDYKHSVAVGRAGTRGSDKTGAVFLAVYRGKVSEGIDFSNDNARAVLAVGIPFPSVKELQVALKREYQDEKSRVDKSLVNGHTWYQLQAFRALNQALGRCIRHRADYGAILLLDSRHRGNAHTRSLSKWMRPFLQEVEQSEFLLPHFAGFFKRNEQELGTGVSAVALTPAPAAPMRLTYESSGSDATAHKATPKPPPSRSRADSTRQSTVQSVRAYLAEKRQGADTPRVFSIFQQGKPAPSPFSASQPKGGGGASAAPPPSSANASRR
ncbi:hypothetical protein PybrP1_000774 [[Pythium] brassicae (nom. inval.)]|nr:hypothetical protein PybrP1_000774 [[Pythium] brassicae (nom. inval.)]